MNVSPSCFLIFFAWFVFFVPDALGDADNYKVADPLVTPAHIVPEWYFLPFYAILRAIPESKLLGVIAMFSSIIVLAFLPWLDWSKVRSGKYRPTFQIFFWLFIACGIGLGYLGAQPVTDMGTLISKLLVAYYFGFFIIILPALGLFETPLKMPASIAEAVLGPDGPGSGLPKSAAAEPSVKG